MKAGLFAEVCASVGRREYELWWPIVVDFVKKRLCGSVGANGLLNAVSDDILLGSRGFTGYICAIATVGVCRPPTAEAARHSTFPINWMPMLWVFLMDMSTRSLVPPTISPFLFPYLN